jgi:hypothetical protein
VETWLKPADLAHQQPLVEWNSGAPSTVDAYGVHVWINIPIDGVGGPGNVFLNNFDTAGNSHYLVTAANTLTVNTWQHIAVTYRKSDGVASIYINGQLAAS